MEHLKLVADSGDSSPECLISLVNQKIIMGCDADITPSFEEDFQELQIIKTDLLFSFQSVASARRSSFTKPDIRLHGDQSPDIFSLRRMFA
jgi:hypothetical protein